jgi:hypothetical protein
MHVDIFSRSSPMEEGYNVPVAGGRPAGSMVAVCAVRIRTGESACYLGTVASVEGLREAGSCPPQPTLRRTTLLGFLAAK